MLNERLAMRHQRSLRCAGGSGSVHYHLVCIQIYRIIINIRLGVIIIGDEQFIVVSGSGAICHVPDYM